MPIEHANIGSSQAHEPKGIESAALNSVYVADAAGSGTWQVASTGSPGVVKLIAADANLMLSSLMALTLGTTGATDTTLTTVSGSGADADINNNFSDLGARANTIATQISSIVTDLNDLKAKMRTAGILTT